ncbi:HAD family hydrolase [Rathayibacter rathayi]|uniref:HAD-IB family hydrolase n=1 Tax=Rathayibacter rathayi TaxID=33887 RepID=A0ABX5AEW3_RATRA|nr:HAD-IB family hydrolase [Rathayibacter rathayi]PPF24288.1 HAD-IB family hydrolase [Rathayibacter rathayi]PPF51609.1 HAD-IB family hydrolase [Rathayibacter rathayi]PPF83200.1 HAD-IB family hydrolase [Rathayibacter rathayi]PPG47030.1 HAD-IB family hydrolase [Rathayibacter rathayi]PPG96509.1 HAD-IB family hydrolase [Rathayibacter rathayi]
MRNAAFFDLDRTLLTVNGMNSFLSTYQPTRDVEGHSRRVRDIRASTATRFEKNQAYFRLFAGEPVAHVYDEGRRFTAAAIDQGGFFRDHVLAVVDRHRGDGADIVIVSGSADWLVRPITERLGAAGHFCTVAVSRDGLLSGTTGAPMLDERKGDAIRSWAVTREVELAASHSYGDHLSDLDALQAVGHPIAVYPTPELRERAVALGWEILE